MLLLSVLLHAIVLAVHDKVKVVTVVSLMANCLEPLPSLTLSVTVSRQLDVLVCRHSCNVMHVDTLATSLLPPSLASCSV